MGFKMILYIFGALMAFYAIKAIWAIISSYSDTPERSGEKYETEVADKIKSVFKVNAIRNMIFNPAEDFEKAVLKGSMDKLDWLSLAMKETELDEAFVTNKGIFCLECKSRKNEKDAFHGSLNHPMWDVGFDRIENPFNQNYKHVRTVYENIVDNGKRCVYNIVVTNANFNFVRFGKTISNKETPVVDMLTNSDEMMALVKEGRGSKGLKELKKHIEKLPDILTDDEVRRYTDMLTKLQASKKERKLHESNMFYVQELMGKHHN